MYNIIILGAGGMGRETCEVIEDAYVNNLSYRIKGFLSDVPDALKNFEMNYPPLIGSIKDYEIQDNDRFVLAIGDVAGRRKVAESILQRGGKFLTLIHPTAKVFRTATLGQGVIIFPFAYVGADAVVGDFCLINSYAGCGHDVKLGAFSEQCPYSALSGGVETGEECFFGVHSVVAPKTKLGNRVVISQGSALQKSQLDDSLIVGVPGKKIRQIHLS